MTGQEWNTQLTEDLLKDQGYAPADRLAAFAEIEILGSSLRSQSGGNVFGNEMLELSNEEIEELEMERTN